MKTDSSKLTPDYARPAERALVDAAFAQFERLTGQSRAERTDATLSMNLPGYRLLGEIHRGGQGVVYQALQESTRRKVAIKVLKHGPFADRTELARFDREVDVLSRLNHPHIVAIHDRGLSSGHAYYVMDYIPGRPLDAHVAAEDLSVEELLRVFVKVCDAVNVAHLRGVIHRDLKPGNIRIDEEGEPRILDFGLAKLEQEIAGGSSAQAMTMTGQFVGSLPWASPEQAGGDTDALDIRTDVYSLGVVLYQLLAGRFPYPVSGRLTDILRNISQTQPARLAGSGRRFDHDLELIVLKALAKEPERRYQSAGELARDIRRYLAHEPVEATSPNAGYRLRKFVRRNRAAVIAAGAIAATLVVGTSVSIAFAVRASRALAAAEEQRAAAQQSAEETQQVARFQSSLLSGIDVQAMGGGFKKLFREQVHDTLNRSFVGEWPARRKLATEEVDAEMAAYDRIAGPVEPVDIARRVLDEYILGNGVEIVKSQFADQPRVQAQLLETLGIICRKLGLFDKAVPPLRIALSLRQADASGDSIKLADCLSELGGAVAGTGDFKEAEQLHRSALALYRARLGDQHPETVRSMDMVAMNQFESGDFAGADAQFREAVALARGLDASDEDLLARVLTDYGGALATRGEMAGAEAVTREALELRRSRLGEESKPYADTLNNLAGILYARREYDECGALLQRCIDIQRKLIGEESVPVATLLNNLGGVLWRKGDRATARVFYAEALAMYRKLLGDEHPEVVGTLNNLAMMTQMDGDLAKSGPMLREALELRRRIRSPDHPEVALSIANLALQLEEEGDLVQAESLYREAVAIDSRKLAPCHSWRVSAEIGLLRVLRKQQKIDEMERLLTEFYEPVRTANPDEDCRIDYVKSFVRLYEEKHKAAPGQGFDARAAEWRASTQPAATP
jgi:tetratricopeptide (TPR) repeat protein